jgi:hypothetical protein
MNTEKISRSLGITYHFDANRIFPKNNDQDIAQLEKWHSNGVIFIEMSRCAQIEAETGSTAREDKASEFTFTEATGSVGLEWKELIQKAVFPNGISKPSDTNDIEILFTAKLADATLITRDGESKTQPRGILGSRSDLEKIGIQVMRANEAVNQIRELIKKRDYKAKELANDGKINLPLWVGCD